MYTPASTVVTASIATIITITTITSTFTTARPILIFCTWAMGVFREVLGSNLEMTAFTAYRGLKL